MPITDVECPDCGAFFHSDNIDFEKNPTCALGCGNEIERERVEEFNQNNAN
jgi:hypothetical protein